MWEAGDIAICIKDGREVDRGTPCVLHGRACVRYVEVGSEYLVIDVQDQCPNCGSPGLQLRGMECWLWCCTIFRKKSPGEEPAKKLVKKTPKKDLIDA